MSDTGPPRTGSGPPPGPAGRPLPPPPPAPPRTTWWVGLVAIGAVIVAMAAGVGIAVVARRGDDSSPPATPRSAPPTTLMVVPTETAPPAPDGTAFTDPQARYTITLGPAWTDMSWRAAPETEAWAVADTVDDGVTPNVNVLTQAAVGADLDALLAGSIVDVATVDGQVLHHAYVTTAGGTELATMRYTATAPGSPIELSFLAVFGVRDGTAVIATLTAPSDHFDALATEIGPYLLTLRVTG